MQHIFFLSFSFYPVLSSVSLDSDNEASTAQHKHRPAQHSTAQHRPAQHRPAQHTCTHVYIPASLLRPKVVPYHTIPYRTIPYRSSPSISSTTRSRTLIHTMHSCIISSQSLDVKQPPTPHCTPPTTKEGTYLTYPGKSFLPKLGR